MMELILHIKESCGQWRLIGFAYVLQFILALVTGLGMYYLIDDSLAHTSAMGRISEGWDYTVVTDFLFHQAKQIKEIKSSLLIVTLIYLPIAAILNSGIWSCLEKGISRTRDIGEGIKQYWGRFLATGIWASLLVIIWSIVAWMPYTQNVMIWMEQKPDERFIVWVGLINILIWIFGLLAIFLLANITRATYILTNVSWWRGLKSSFSIFYYKSKTLVIPVFVVAFLGVSLILFVMWLEAQIGNKSVSLMILFFLIQQAIVVFKICLRVGLWGYFLHVVRTSMSS